MFAIRKERQSFPLTALKPAVRWVSLATWTGGLLLSMYLNGGSGHLARPAALYLAAMVVCTTAVAAWLLANRGDVWLFATKPGTDQSMHAPVLRKIAYVGGLIGVSCFVGATIG